MDLSTPSTANDAVCELCFQSLFAPGRGYCFPCDAGGRVDLDAMNERQRNSYFYARAVVGRDLMPPTIRKPAH